MPSGPTCTQLLAWFGADLIKVERAGAGNAMQIGALHEEVVV